MSVPMQEMSALPQPMVGVGAGMAPPPGPETAEMEDAGPDFDVAVGLMLRLMYKEEAMAEIKKGLQSGDFVETAAALIADMTVQVREQMLGKDLVEDERIWAAEGGVMHTIADYFVEIGQELGIEAAFDEAMPDAIFQRAVQSLQEAEQGGAAQAAPGGQPPANTMPPPTAALGGMR